VTVYHCPLCPLIFEHRTDLDRHLDQEHRSRGGPAADLGADLVAAPIALDWNSLKAIRAAAGGPSVSLLLATTPASTMTVLDVARLRQLADQARRRLPAEPGSGIAVPVVEHRLSRALAIAECSRTDRGLALLVSCSEMAVVALPFGPRDRVIVDRKFATRDLELALQRYPMMRVVLLGRHPRIFEGRGRDLSEIDTARLRADHPRVLPPGTEQPDLDRLLDRRVEISGILPLVVIGDRRRRQAFRQHSCHAGDVRAEAHRPRTRSADVCDLALKALLRWHLDEQERALTDLRQASTLDLVEWGLMATWHAVATKRADRIWVDQDFAQPGRIASSGDEVEITSDPAEPGAHDDLVDTLVAQAQLDGVPVVLLESGVLRRDEPIATKVRSADEEPRGTGFATPCSPAGFTPHDLHSTSTDDAMTRVRMSDGSQRATR
jgi:hypothetical protein